MLNILTVIIGKILGIDRQIFLFIISNYLQ